MVIFVAFLFVALFFGLGFALHWLWFVAVFYLLFWTIGVVLGRGASAGHHRFYRW